MRVKDYIENLPEPARSAAMFNMGKFGTNDLKTVNGPRKALLLAFEWALTKEGFSHWHSIMKQLPAVLNKHRMMALKGLQKKKTA